MVCTNLALVINRRGDVSVDLGLVIFISCSQRRQIRQHLVWLLFSAFISRVLDVRQFPLYIILDKRPYLVVALLLGLVAAFNIQALYLLLGNINNEYALLFPSRVSS